ncbi:hypothetical protein QI633_25085 [Nocardioides sp. QY071]|uniref:hypothetical protein n=1 Tax=Nocardioides sp. QY071 TaxID=3044187 RepID=UPI00249B3CAC|nr:hypothetical protein [Nocardioides sp. QY071]WGY01796.1 hypothetical protein QI633_25085 [Nocardioides sp. QY071]
MTTMSETRYTLALQEARRGFDQLAHEVSVVRDRATSILGMGGLAASFLGGLSIRDGAPVTGWTWLAVISFVALASLCVVVLWPRRFHVSQDPASMVSWAEQHKATPNQMERDLALWLGMKYDENREGVDRLGRLQSMASIAFLIEIAALILDLLTR